MPCSDKRADDRQCWCHHDKSGNSSSWLANSRVERCRTDDLMPNVPISCLPPSHNHKVLPPGVYNTPGWSVAVLSTWCQTSLSLAFLQATTTKCYHLVCTTLQSESRTDNLMPNIPISCLPPSCVDPKVQGLKVIIDCPQPGSLVLGWPTGLLQSAGGLSAAAMTQWWSCSGAVRARCPKNSAGVTWPNPAPVSRRWCFALYR